ncbi:hypothetical protein [Streptomyces sp. MNP-20]|uniref:deoxynucleotide monophosphate kinase family protein n=1 Tax=Streptomyces sp. MNP-20 TaxID=2721165 RepID=UPI0015518EEE|nr:hypothetical protein [Streptomyces sp. MNP-20]
MRHPHIALIGRARSGKDSVAARLVSQHAYTRVAFADPLRDMCLSVDPIIAYEPSGFGQLPIRLSDEVRRTGWERAKDQRKEVRRLMQRLGAGVREHDPAYWLSLALDKIGVADEWSLPVVVTDCRYPNEAEALKGRGFKFVRIIRPGLPRAGSEHESETAMDDYPVDVTIANVGTLADLNDLADKLT